MGDPTNIFTDYPEIPESASIPAGEYRCKIVKLNPKVSAKNPEIVGLNAQLQIVEGKLKGAMVFDNLLFIKTDPAQERYYRERSLAKVRGMFASAGFVPEMTGFQGHIMDSAQTIKMAEEYLKPSLTGKLVTVKLTERDGDNMVNVYVPPGGAAGTAPAGAPTPPAGAAPPPQGI